MIGSKKNSYLIIFSVYIFSLSFISDFFSRNTHSEISIFSTNDCTCKQNDTIKVCYLPNDPYCLGFDLTICNYSLDGFFMENSLSLKLLNPAYFGPTGIVKNSLILDPIQDITSVEDITCQACDLFFVGSFNIDTIAGTGSNTATSVPQATLEHIKAWSTNCESNLVIVGQAEAVPWGYSVGNVNVNPNFPAPNNTLFSIFDRPFGVVDSFNQGGNYQAVITDGPPSGYQVLAVDAEGRPTVVLDSTTNDIIVSDISLFANAPGVMTLGDQINNQQDIFACNTFAYGCQIASGVSSAMSVLEICPGEPARLPSGGITTQAGFFVDTILNFKGCDSIVLTEVIELYTDSSLFEWTGCQGDSFSILANNIIYNQANPDGVEILQNSVGCDSIINIQLTFLPNSEETFEMEYCEDSNFSLTVNGEVYNENNPIGMELLQNFRGCDSVIFVDLNFEKIDTSYVEYFVCKNSSISIQGQAYFEGETDIITIDGNGICDSAIVFQVFEYPEPTIQIPEEVYISTSGQGVFETIIPNHLEIKWTPTIGLSCDDCPNPRITKVEPEIPSYLLTVSDSNSCSFAYEIKLKYNKEPFIPNAFSPNDDGINDFFEFFFPYNEDEILVKKFIIYNRWGGIVFKNENELHSTNQFRWDGTNMDIGVYIYLIELGYSNGEQVSLSGDLTLIR